MIHRLYSSDNRFKTLEFKPGLNILISDRSPGSTDLHTRNRSGKTSFVETVHFMMGSNTDPKSIFVSPDLREHTFGLDFDLAGQSTTVERSGQQAKDLRVMDTDTAFWTVPPRVDKKSGELLISNTRWRLLLGNLMFGLPTEKQDRYSPAFRQLFAYFSRRQGSGAFTSPTKQSEMQQLWDQQVAICFLLGLDWTIPQQWEFVRERERTLRELRKAAGQGAFGAVLGTVADLRTRLAVAEEHNRRLEADLQKFHVIDEYRQLELEASELSLRVGELSDGNTIDRQLVAELEAAIQREVDPPLDDLQQLYGEVGVILPQAVVRRFEDVRAFHASIVANRHSYLGAELDSARQRVAQREQQQVQLQDRLSEIMNIMRTGGALEQFYQLQGELGRQQGDTEALRQQFIAAEQLEGQKTELDLERAQLLIRLRQDFREQAETLNRAIVVFEQVSRSLYNEAGSLLVSESDNGPVFDFPIQGSRSTGISNMQIFCFDMMLMRLCAERGMGPGFLIHDSHLFDPVDERQIARALQVGEETASALGFQYIVTMNSDQVPSSWPKGFSPNEHILSVRLTDAKDDGGLFGFRFG
jgi:uncharacterized protein YydD (DUF2326 family)